MLRCIRCRPTDRAAERVALGDVGRRAQLASEITANGNAIISRLPGKDQTGRNVFLYTAGVFLILPLFAMDPRLYRAQCVVARAWRASELRHAAAEGEDGIG